MADAVDAAVRAGLETVFGVFPLTTNTFIFLMLMLTLSPGSLLQHNDISINLRKRNDFLVLMLMLMSRQFTCTLSYAYVVRKL